LPYICSFIAQIRLLKVSALLILIFSFPRPFPLNKVLANLESSSGKSRKSKAGFRHFLENCWDTPSSLLVLDSEWNCLLFPGVVWVLVMSVLMRTFFAFFKIIKWRNKLIWIWWSQKVRKNKFIILAFEIHLTGVECFEIVIKRAVNFHYWGLVSTSVTVIRCRPNGN